MNMKRSNYLGVLVWMDKVCKYSPYLCWWTTLKAREGMSDTDDEHPLLCPQWPSILHWERPSSFCIDDSCCWRISLLQWPHKRWRWMDTHLIKSEPDYMKMEGGNWRWMHAFASNPAPCFAWIHPLPELMMKQLMKVIN